ncbi:LAQU0S01e08548g1_1 [Lachancea quebecensis]|uniref:LAQU0S01e08548g1_1 n=1 Tax=Lachancea quebecensis TaxID=1654605 RepID=A0A0P1KMB0_9SACH|nr:LAQU0S01e08548g1_1 [Lachancea quebecensis]
MEGSVGMNPIPTLPTYTLPGVMHYLQTEFTRNERDRIGWELERSEMKTRIAQLEGENRTLRYELAKQKPLSDEADQSSLSGDLAIQEPLLLKSKLAVQENVKEIIYLLRSPNVTEQLHELGNSADVVHGLEAMNLNLPLNQHQHHQQLQRQQQSKSQSQRHTQHQRQPPQQDYSDLPSQSIRQAPVESFTPEIGLQARPVGGQSEYTTGVFNDTASDQGSEVDTIVPDESAPTRPRASSLFSSKSGSIAPNHILRCKRLRYHLAGVEKLIISHHNLLSYARDGLMKHWLIEPNLNCNDKLTKSFHGLAPIVLGLYWLDNQTFFTVDNFGLKVWLTTESAPHLSLDVFDGSSNVSFSDIGSIDFKNGWLVLTCTDVVHIWEVFVGEKVIKIGSRHKVEGTGKVISSILGMTEKSLILFKEDPFELVIYTFGGDVLQRISLQEEVSKQTDSTDTNNDGSKKLLLNKQSSKLLIQLGRYVAVYSFDRKKIVLSKQLPMAPTSAIFRSPKDYVIFAYDDGLIEMRNINNFQDVVKTYNHYDDETEYEDEEDTKATAPNTAEKEVMDEVRQTASKGVIIDMTEIDSAAVIVSGGDDGIIRLERVEECG